MSTVSARLYRQFLNIPQENHVTAVLLLFSNVYYTHTITQNIIETADIRVLLRKACCFGQLLWATASWPRLWWRHHFTMTSLSAVIFTFIFWRRWAVVVVPDDKNLMNFNFYIFQKIGEDQREQNLPKSCSIHQNQRSKFSHVLIQKISETFNTPGLGMRR